MTRSTLALGALAASLMLPISPALAGPITKAECTARGGVWDNSRQECKFSVRIPGQPGQPGKPKPGSGKPGTGPGKARECKHMGVFISCYRDGGVWVDAMKCYVKRVNPQPPKTDPVWQGKTDGAIYNCNNIGLQAGALDMNYWRETPPEELQAAADPAALARDLIASLTIVAPGIGSTPPDDPGRIGVVGLPTWLWVEDPGPTTLGPLTDSVSAGGITVTVVATVEKIEWNMGDGTTITCTGGGTPWTPDKGIVPSPDCGHLYTTEGTYPIQAKVYWNAAWQGGGQSGVVPLEVSNTTTLRIGELQALRQ